MSFRFRKDGSLARLSLFLPIFCGFQMAVAWDDPFQSLTGLDYDRHVWMRFDPCRTPGSWDAIPVSHRMTGICSEKVSDSASSPISISTDLDYFDLVHESGGNALDLNRINAGINLRWRPRPALEFRSTTGATHQVQDIGDTSLFAHQNDTVWETQNALAFPLSPLFVPFITWNVSSQDGSDGNVGFRGKISPGISWSLGLGEKNTRYPVRLKLEDYEPLTVPFLFHQDYRAFSVSYHPGPWQVSWKGRWMTLLPDARPKSLYSVSDSGEAQEHLLALGVNDSGSGRILYARVEGQMNFGNHVLRGIRTAQTQYQFGYELAHHVTEALRVDLGLGNRVWEGGIFAGVSGIRWNGYRPGVPDKHYFWDRNGVLDSYDGNILNLFESQTWLFDGHLSLRQWAAGAWAGHATGRWRTRLGLNYNYLDLRGSGDLTKKTTELLLAYTQVDYPQNLPDLRAHFLTPDLRLTRRWGFGFAEMAFAQAIPFHVQVGGAGDASSAAPSPGSSLRGGTRAGIRVGWGDPD